MEEEDVRVKTPYFPKHFGTEHHETAIDFGHDKGFCAGEVATLGIALGEKVLKNVVAKQVTTNAELVTKGIGGAVRAVLLGCDDTCFGMGGEVVDQGGDAVFHQ